MDLGDKTSRYCVLNGDGEVIRNRAWRPRRKRCYRCSAPAAVPDRDGSGNAFAVGEPVAGRLGFEVIVANARQVQLISASSSARTTGWTRKRWRGWRGWIRSYCGRSGIAARSTGTSDDHPHASGAGGDAHQSGERGARICQGAGRAPAGCDADEMGVEKMEGLPQPLRKRLSRCWKKWNR